MAEKAFDYYKKGKGEIANNNDQYARTSYSAMLQSYLTGNKTGAGYLYPGKKPPKPVTDIDDGDNDDGDNDSYDTLLSEIKNLAQQKYDAQINLINTYLEQQRKANQQEYEANRDQAEVNYFNGLRRMREQNGNTNGYNDSGLNRTNQLYFNSSRANTNSNLRKALDANNINAEYNAQAMRTSATNNYYDDYQTYLNMLNKYIKK